MHVDLIDLHVHTTASDGTMTPEEVVFHARDNGLKALAITDHDTVSGVKEALDAGEKAGIEVIPGVEISVEYRGEMHILGYFLDIKNQNLQKGLNLLRRYREERNPVMVEKLRELGFDITIEEAANKAGGDVIGRPHIASVLVEKGYVKDSREAFEKYIGSGKLAYVERKRFSPQEGIELILNAGGVPVLAHPKYTATENEAEFEALIKKLISLGLKGIEVYYPDHTPKETEKFKSLANRFGLLMTGGTDFHGGNRPHIKLGRGKGDFFVDYKLLEKLKAET